MNKYTCLHLLPLVILLLTLSHCTLTQKTSKQPSSTSKQMEPMEPQIKTVADSIYYDKVLGMLVGSAIGDAMSTGTEMWPRNKILAVYGNIEELKSVVRQPSAEGTYKHVMQPGGTTDDTRWKKLASEFLITQENWGDISSTEFAGFLVDYYLNTQIAIKNQEISDPEPFESNYRDMMFLKEWALVAKTYKDHLHESYRTALDQFYGGEMTPAGMLYTPVFGVVYPKSPTDTYSLAFDNAIFDHGYARDLSALVAAMVSEAFRTDISSQRLSYLLEQVDPKGFFNSRLIGRTAHKIFIKAKEIVFEARTPVAIDSVDTLSNPLMRFEWKNFTNKELIYLHKAYTLLDENNHEIQFNPREIFLTILTAFEFCRYDFEKTMAFITNYGRDNDTAGAIAGAILGASEGYQKLPKTMREQVLKTNLEELNIDLKKVAIDLLTHKQGLNQ